MKRVMVPTRVPPLLNGARRGVARYTASASQYGRDAGAVLAFRSELPHRASPPAPAQRRAAPPGRRDPCRSTTWSPRCSCARASTSRSRSPRCPASSSTRARACARRWPSWPTLGVPGVILFGVPGAQGRRRLGGVGPRRHRAGGPARPARRGRRRLVLMADLLPRRVHRPRPLRRARRATGEVDNDATIELLRPRSPSPRPTAGADVVRPERDDGRPGRRHPRRARRRRATPTPRSSPTRPSTPRRCTGRSATRSTCTIVGGGDRKGYQQDWRNAREALVEVRADVAQGADMVMVKPALAYLDVIAAVRGRGRRAARGVPRVRRVLDDQGGGRATAGSTATPWRSSTSPRSSGPAPT